MGVRHRAREAALRLLYQLELTGDETDSALGTYWSELPPKLANGRTYAEVLVSAVRSRTDEIDTLIDAAASNWQLSRIARIDLCILRIAVAEMLQRKIHQDVLTPPAEAVRVRCAANGERGIILGAASLVLYELFEPSQRVFIHTERMQAATKHQLVKLN